MEPSTQAACRSIDVTGLPEEAIRALEAEVAALRASQPRPHGAYSSHEEWSKALREWIDSHPKTDHFVDWSRESIYGDDGR
jgi:hypothetical protein